MAWTSACHTHLQNFLLSGEDELAGAASTEDNNTLFVSFAAIPAVIVAPLLVLASSSVAQYLENDLQQILKIFLDFGPSAPFPTLAPAFQQYKGPCESPLKARFPDVYWGKTHLKCYNFFQQCEDHFATVGAKGQNQLLFIANFLKDTALFCWH